MVVLDGLDINISKILDKIYPGIAILNEKFECLAINDLMASFYKSTPKEMLGKELSFVFPEWEKSIFYETIVETVKTGKSLQKFGYSENSKNFLSLSTYKYDDNKFMFCVNFIKEKRDLSLEKNDALTGIYNRYKYEEDIQFCVDLIKEREKEGFNFSSSRSTIFLIDIKRFNLINNINGTEIGDLCLMEIASKLKFKIKTDEVLYRIAGDKFLLLINNKYEKVDINKKIQELQNCFDVELNIKGLSIKIDLRFGVFFDIKYNDFLNGLKYSELALREAKKRNLNSYFYSEDLNNGINILEIEKEIKRGLINNEFELYYQPQISLKDNKIIGAEALIRWNHKTKGLIFPDYFLPIAYEFGFVDEIDRFVVKQALIDQKIILKNKNIKLSVNLSSDAFNIRDLQKAILNNLKNEKNKLCFEITETGLVDIEKSKFFINKLKDLGHMISIDDFGTGYCSLEYLLNYSADFIKIEKKFIKNIEKSSKNQKICKNIIKLGKSLGIKVVAEGIEREEEERILKDYNCDIVQGYLYSKPIKLNDFINLLNKNLALFKK